MTGIRCDVHYEPCFLTGMTYARNFRLYLMQEKDVWILFRYEPYLMTGMTYARNFRLYPNDWNKMCGPL